MSPTRPGTSRRSSRTFRVRRIAPSTTVAGLAVFAVVLAVSACGVPRNGELRPLGTDDLPAALVETTVVTTTTTVPSDPAATPGDSVAPATVYEPVELYFISANRAVSTTRLLVSPATPTQVLATLLEGISGEEASTGLRSALPSRFSATVEIRRGVALISATAPFLSDLSPTDQRLAIAQIVLTLTRRPGIGQVSFRVDGTEIAVPRGAGDLTTAGGAVTFDDFVVLLSRD